MDQTPQVTLGDAVRYALDNSDNLNYENMVSTLAAQQPHMFIRLMGNLGVDIDAFAAEFARHNPGMFIATAMRNVKQFEGSREALRLMRNNEKVNAIKKIREIFGLGLKEAKDVHDALQEDINQGTFFTHFHLPVPSQDALRIIRQNAGDLIKGTS